MGYETTFIVWIILGHMALQVLTIQEAADTVPSEMKDAQAEKCLVQLATLHTVRKKKGRSARGSRLSPRLTLFRKDILGLVAHLFIQSRS